MRNFLFVVLFCFICLVGWADTVTYYFNDYDAGGEEWETNPANMVDGDTGTLANSSPEYLDIELCNSNTCDGSGSGSITKVELRVYAKTNYFNNETIVVRPVFSGGDGDDHTLTLYTTAQWSSYVDITSDTNAPATWTWSGIQNLDCDIEYNPTNGSSANCYKVEIQVTYTPGEEDQPAVFFGANF